MRDLQQTLAELEREEREMAAQRLSGSAGAPLHQATSTQCVPNSILTDAAQDSLTLQNHQVH